MGDELMSDLRERLSNAVGSALFNTSNYPPEAQPYILGRSFATLEAAVFDAVLAEFPHLAKQRHVEYGLIVPSLVQPVVCTGTREHVEREQETWDEFGNGRPSYIAQRYAATPWRPVTEEENA